MKEIIKLNLQHKKTNKIMKKKKFLLSVFVVAATD